MKNSTGGRLYISLNLKLFILASVIFIVISVIIGFFVTNYITTMVVKTIESETERIEDQIKNGWLNDEQTTLTLATSLADRQDVEEILLTKNKNDAGYELLKPLFDELKANYRITEINLIDAEGFVLIAMDDKDEKGTSALSNASIAKALETQRPESGFDMDDHGPDVHGVVPVIIGQKIVGLVEVAIGYPPSFFEGIKKNTGADVTLWIYKQTTTHIELKPVKNGQAAPDENFFYYFGTKESDYPFTADMFKAVVDGKQTLQQIYKPDAFSNLLGSSSRAEISRLVPMLGDNDVFYGIMEITVPYQEQLDIANAENNSSQYLRFFFVFVGLVVIGITLNLTVLRPIQTISSYMAQYINGKSHTQLQIKTGDEFEQLSEQFNQMVSSVNESRQDLEQLVKQRTEQLETVNQVATAANSILDPDELIKRVITLITEKFEYYYAALYLTIENGRWAELRDATGTAGEIQKARHHRLQISGNNTVGLAITDKKARVASAEGDSAVKFNNPLLPNTRSEVALPLIVGERVIGALNVHSTKESAFNEEAVATLQSMTNQVATALENARLFREINDSLDELRQANQQYITSAWADKTKTNKLEFSTQASALLNTAPEQIQDVKIPLTLREQPIGQINIETEEEWSLEDQAWVEALATQVAVSLENSRLLEESQQSALRERLSASIIQKIWTANNIDIILQTAVKELGRALEASEASIELKMDD